MTLKPKIPEKRQELTRRTTSIKLTQELDEKLQALAQKHEISVSSIINAAIEFYFDALKLDMPEALPEPRGTASGAEPQDA